jgi:hypothetical protein
LSVGRVYEGGKVSKQKTKHQWWTPAWRPVSVARETVKHQIKQRIRDYGPVTIDNIAVEFNMSHALYCPLCIGKCVARGSQGSCLTIARVYSRVSVRSIWAVMFVKEMLFSIKLWQETSPGCIIMNQRVRDNQCNNQLIASQLLLIVNVAFGPWVCFLHLHGYFQHWDINCPKYLQKAFTPRPYFEQLHWSLCLLAVVTKMSGLENKFKWFLLTVRQKMGEEIVGSVNQQCVRFSFLTCHIKIVSPKQLIISLGVIMDSFSVLDNTFSYCAFWLW